MDEYVQIASKLVESREKYQRRLGEIASKVTGAFGPNSLTTLSDAVLDATGRKLSISTLRNYRWVYERTVNLSLPEDLSYQVLQHIAMSDTPNVWAKRIEDEGLTSAQIMRLFRQDKPKKVILCPSCGKEVIA